MVCELWAILFSHFLCKSWNLKAFSHLSILHINSHRIDYFDYIKTFRCISHANYLIAPRFTFVNISTPRTVFCCFMRSYQLTHTQMQTFFVTNKCQRRPIALVAMHWLNIDSTHTHTHKNILTHMHKAGS